VDGRLLPQDEVLLVPLLLQDREHVAERRAEFVEKGV
jgi:hypothetical protein